MSWLFSQALAGEFWEANCSDGELSAQSNGSHMQQAYCAPDKMMAFSKVSRFGMMFKPLTENLGEELLTLYLAAFHAKTSAQQEKAQELTESEAECGEKWRGSFAKWNQDSYSWKTHQCSLLGGLEPFSETWPRWGLMLDGECWEQPTLEQTIRGTESGLSEKWPTPRSCSAMAATITPESAWYKNRNPNLETIVGRKMFPTPTCHNSKEGAFPAEYNRKTPTLATHAGGKLNPDWVEWLMNWPIKWSDINGCGEKELERWKKASTAPLQESIQMRTMWWDRDPSQASHRSQHKQQQEQQYSDSLYQVSRIASCESAMGRSHEEQNLSVLRNSVYLQAPKGENLQQRVREQTCMDETQIVPRVNQSVISQVDRLKAIGNGQVPLCAATAWKILNALH